MCIRDSTEVFVGSAVRAGLFVGSDLGVFVGIGALRVAVGRAGLFSDDVASTVASILEVGSAGVGAALEQLSAKIPKNMASTSTFNTFPP